MYEKLKQPLRKKQTSKLFYYKYSIPRNDSTVLLIHSSRLLEDKEVEALQGSLSKITDLQRLISPITDIIFEQIKDSVYLKGYGLYYLQEWRLISVLTEDIQVKEKLAKYREYREMNNIRSFTFIGQYGQFKVSSMIANLKQSEIETVVNECYLDTPGDFFCTHVGFMHQDSWKEFLPKKVIDGEIKLNHWHNNESTKVTVINCLKSKSESFREWYLERGNNSNISENNDDQKPKVVLSDSKNKKNISVSHSTESRDIKWLENLFYLRCKKYVKEGDIYVVGDKAFYDHLYQTSNTTLTGLSKDYNSKLSDEFLSRGIKLYHLWESTDVSLKESIVLSKLGLCKTIFARKCEIVEPSSKEHKLFFDENHVDGHTMAHKVFCLRYNNVNVAMLSLMKRNIQSTKTSVWEIGRFATLKGHTVVGGYSKLLKNALIYLSSIGVHSLVSYCNRDLSPDKDKNFYAKYGFIFIQESGSVYWYWASRDTSINGKECKMGTILSRQFLQKQKLLKHYSDNNLPLPEPCSEKTLAYNLGFYPVYNSGNFKYLLEF